MIVFKEILPLTKHIAALKKEGHSIGLVPTMGALHDGHLSLIELSNKQVDITVASIFINPTQFNDPKDFEKYPVTIEKDTTILENAGCDILFLPAISEIYPDGIKPFMHYELGDIEHLLEGKFRPGHFQGVAQVVHRLIDIVLPDHLFLGSKDYQQCMVIKKLVKIINAKVNVVTSETFREENGLAMSSRNLRLSPLQKEQASAIYKSLLDIKNNYSNTPFSTLEQKAFAYLLQNGFNKVDYVSIADASSLLPAEVGQQQHLVVLIAAFIGDVRLIDNMVIAE